MKRPGRWSGRISSLSRKVTHKWHQTYTSGWFGWRFHPTWYPWRCIHRWPMRWTIPYLRSEPASPGCSCCNCIVRSDESLPSLPAGVYKGGETMRVKVRSVWKYLIALVFKALERGRSELGGKTKRLHRFTSSLHLNLVWTPFKWISLH